VALVIGNGVPSLGKVAHESNINVITESQYLYKAARYKSQSTSHCGEPQPRRKARRKQAAGT
jgi:hypothetical protein